MKLIAWGKFISVILISGISFTTLAENTTLDPLPSWHDGKAKQRIISFIKETTDPKSKQFITVENRIATFDNDGTLWAEKPVYFQFFFAIDRIKTLAPKHPEWKTEQPFAAVLSNDMDTVMKSGMDGFMKLIIATHTGISTDEFNTLVKNWMKVAKHPVTDQHYVDMTYQPMIEVLKYFRTHGYKTYIVSGGGVEFMRAWAPEVYGIPSEQIIGTRFETKWDMKAGQPVLMRLPKVEFNDDKEGKPVAIQQIIGKRPVAAFGNSDGDMQMLQWTTAGKGPRLSVLIHHTDAQREWAYDKDSHVGKLDSALIEAKKENWLVVDMKKDWQTVFHTEQQHK